MSNYVLGKIVLPVAPLNVSMPEVRATLGRRPIDKLMIDHVAKAMCENRKFVWDHCDKAYWRGAAKAAIEAMREFTVAEKAK